MYINALGASGLYTFPSPLFNPPPGALQQADNVVITADNIIQSRRGLTFIGSEIGLAPDIFIDQIFEFQSEWIVHASDDTLWYSSANPFSAPTWVQYGVDLTPPTGSVRPHGIEANKNWYMTSDNGITKQATVSADPIAAGVPSGLDQSASLATGSWFATASAVAYRVTWSYTDANGNFIEGAPSFRTVLLNASGVDKAVSLVITIPAGITTNHFVNVYRSLQTSSSITPTDELFLAYQAQPSSGEISGKSMTVTDVTPEALLGATFYGSPSQDGPTQYNYPPPLAQDLCLFQNMAFYANTQNLQNVYMTMIAVGATSGVQNGDTITINGMVFTATTGSQDPTTRAFHIVTSGTAASNIDDTSKNLVSCINQATSNTTIYAYYPVGYNDLPGLIYLVARSFTTASFAITASRGGAFSPALPSSGTTYSSSNDTLVNSILVSKVGQPEAVPLTNQIFIGAGDQATLRILALRDSLVVLKTDGIFRVTGTTPDALTVSPFDNTVFLTAPDTAVKLNNSIFAVTSQMVVSISESGVEIESRNIEGTLLALANLSNFNDASFAIPYESEREYILFVPQQSTDEFPSQAYVYNWLLRAWTRWTFGASAGIISQEPDNKLYLGKTSNPEFLYQEVKTFAVDGSDFGDERYAGTITSATGTAVTFTATNISLYAEAGQSLIQGTTKSIITDVSVTSADIVVLTVTDDLVWQMDDASLVVPIEQTVFSIPITGGFSHYTKNWTRCLFNFSNTNFSAITALFASNIKLATQSFDLTPVSAGTEWGVLAWDSGAWGGTTSVPQAISTLVPRDMAYANWIQVGVTLNEAFTNFQYLGPTLTYEIVSDVLR